MALAASPGALEELLPGESALGVGESSLDAAGSALQHHSQAVAIINGPLQEDESQVRTSNTSHHRFADAYDTVTCCQWHDLGLLHATWCNTNE
jgi:hypothetical protein